jgi:hypothetical protein
MTLSLVCGCQAAQGCHLHAHQRYCSSSSPMYTDAQELIGILIMKWKQSPMSQAAASKLLQQPNNSATASLLCTNCHIRSPSSFLHQRRLVTLCCCHSVTSTVCSRTSAVAACTSGVCLCNCTPAVCRRNLAIAACSSSSCCLHTSCL